MRGEIGAPLELYPDKDPNPMLDHDPVINEQKLREKWGAEADKKFAEQEHMNKTDDFNYDPNDQTKCPFAAHIRKCGPRNDHPDYVKHLMLRRGIPYGPMATPAEKAGGVSQFDRGLLFVSYQSSITNGFQTVQKGMSPTNPIAGAISSNYTQHLQTLKMVPRIRKHFAVGLIARELTLSLARCIRHI